MLATSQIQTTPLGSSKDVPASTTTTIPENKAQQEKYTSKWKTTSPVPLTRESFLDLIYGRTPLIKESQFIAKDQAKTLYEHLGPQFSPYLHATGPPVSKVGVAQFEFQAQSQEDFQNRAGDGMSS